MRLLAQHRLLGSTLAVNLQRCGEGKEFVLLLAETSNALWKASPLLGTLEVRVTE